MKDIALEHLRKMTGSPQASFHDGQWESIDGLVNKLNQLLVVQRTGWGKSAVAKSRPIRIISMMGSFLSIGCVNIQSGT